MYQSAWERFLLLPTNVQTPPSKKHSSGQQDPALHFQPNQDQIFHDQSTAQHSSCRAYSQHSSCRAYSGDPHLSISEGPHYLQGVLVFFTRLQVAPIYLWRIHTEAVWLHYCFFHWKRCGTTIGDWGKGEKGRFSKHMDAVHDLTSEVKPLFAGLSEVPVWRHCSSLRGLWEKKNKQQQHTMDADKQTSEQSPGRLQDNGKTY